MPQPEIVRLMDHARIRLPGAIDTAILIEIFSVMKDFFIESNVWREAVPFQVQEALLPASEDPESYSYQITPAVGAFVRLLAVVDEAGRPITATMPEPGRIVLAASPPGPREYVAHLVLTVSDPTTQEDFPQFPLWVLNRYYNDILNGVLGQMMSQIAKPYSSPTMALGHLRTYRRGVGRARVDARKQNVYAAQPWRFPRGFAN